MSNARSPSKYKVPAKIQSQLSRSQAQSLGRPVSLLSVGFLSPFRLLASSRPASPGSEKRHFVPFLSVWLIFLYGLCILSLLVLLFVLVFFCFCQEGFALYGITPLKVGKKELGKSQPTKRLPRFARQSLSLSPSPLLVSSPHNLSPSN